MNRGTIQLPSGRVLNLREMRQWNIYEGLLMGLPTRGMNEHTIAKIVEQERQACGAEPYLIAPQQRPLELGRRYPFGTPATIPPIATVARFGSREPARDRSKDYSWLVIIWFQEEFSLTIDEAVRPSFDAIDWNALAEDRVF